MKHFFLFLRRPWITKDNLSCQTNPFPKRTGIRISTQTFDFAQVVKIVIPEMGDDFDTRLQVEESCMINAGMRVIQIWQNTLNNHLELPLSSTY
jgi:hypothetical protein